MKTNQIANLDIGTYLIPISPQGPPAPPPREPLKVHTKLDFPRKKENQHSNRWLIYALALVLLLLLGLVIYGHRSSAPAKDDSEPSGDHLCVPSREIPPIQSHLLMDDNSTVLAEAAGYVQLLDSELGTGYLPLDFHSIYKENLVHGPILVSLVGDCTTLEITYRMCEWKVNYEYKNFELHIRKVDGIRPQKRCDFEKSKTIYQQPVDSRYSCRQTRSRMCGRMSVDYKGHSKMQQHVAQLVLSSLQLELDGDPLAVQRHEFSKVAWPTSCNIWSV